MTTPPPIDPQGLDPASARELLAAADSLQVEARRELSANSWQWFVVWAVVCLGASLSALTTFAGGYWIAAVPLGIAGTVYFGIRNDRRSGVHRHSGGYWLIGALITVLNFGASIFLEDEVLVVFIWVVFGLGFVGFAVLERQPPAAALFAVITLGVAIGGFVVPDTFDLYIVAGFVFAVAMLGVAIGIRSQGLVR